MARGCINIPSAAINSGVPAGTHSYTAKAYDNLNAVTTSAARTVNVFTIALTSPTAGQNFAVAPASITLTASASPSGALQKVEFFQGNTLINTDTTAPYTYTWTNVPAGNYTFTARATDAQNGTTTSTEVNVTVGAAHQQAQLYYIHPDHLNTPRVITNTAQQVVWRWDNTDPFGANAPNENPSGLGNFTCNLRLPGQYFDRETNLHYNYFRDYDPSIGRYVQSDPIGLKGGINTYAYVGGNPLAKIDPKGLYVPDDGGGGPRGDGFCRVFAEIPFGIYGPSLPQPKDTDRVFLWYCIWRCEDRSCPPKVTWPQGIILSSIIGCPSQPPPWIKR